jgi:hypothetical protein
MKKQSTPKACLKHEVPSLGITAVVSDQGLAELLEQRLKRIEQAKVIEAKPTEKVDVRLPPPIPDRRFRRI